MTLADEDTNSILTDYANRAIQGNVAMQVTEVAPSGPVVSLAMFIFNPIKTTFNKSKR